MKYQFKQAVKIGSRLYALGFHFVEPDHVEHRFFQHLLKHGLVVPQDVASNSAPKLEVDFNSLTPEVKALAEKVLNKKKAEQEKSHAESVGSEPPSDEKGKSGEPEAPDLLNDEEKKPAKKRK